MANVAVTTVDNPFNPITDFENWYAYDEAKGYHTSSYLARLVTTYSDMSDADLEAAVEEAVDKIVKLNLNGMYKKVTIE